MILLASIILIVLPVEIVVSAVPEILVRSQCQAQCLEKYGGRYTKTTQSGTVLSPYMCFDDCKDCWSACELHLPSLEFCFDLCSRIKNQTTCRSGCQFHFALKDKMAEPSAGALQHLPGVVKRVNLLCMNLQGNVESPSVLGTFFIELNETVSRPHLYVVYVRQKVRTPPDTTHPADSDRYRISDWYPLGIRTEQTFALHKLLTGVEYQLKARTVFPDYVTDESSDNVWFHSLSGDAQLSPPASVSIVRQFVENGKLLAQISWIPDSAFLTDPSCFYHLVWRNDFTTEYRTFPVEEKFGYVLDKLNYSMNYTILIRSVSSLKFPRMESATVATGFRSWSCLEANRFDFQICEPGPVLNLTAYVVNGTAIVHWQKPRYVTVSNEIDHYAVRWRTLPHLGRCFNNLEKKFNLFSNETSVTLDLGKNCFYVFEIAAVSTGGKSPVTSVVFDHTVIEVIENNATYISSSFQTAYFVLIPVSVGIIVVGVLIGLRLRPKPDTKQKIAPTIDRAWLRLILQRYGPNPWYEPNSENGQSMDSSVDLLGDLSPWIVETENLGSGHFGCVWKAICTAPGLPSVVAVKKLKTHHWAAISESEKHLQNEFMLMKEKISVHPNIVTFYGVCTCPELKLVMEFCSEGSLKNYLTEIRDTLMAKPQASPAADSGFYQNYDVTDVQMSSSTRINVALVDSALLLSYARQIAAGMEHLANCNLVHRDLATRNVLVTEKGKVVKVSDFGLCREGGVYQQCNNDAVPWKWLAPESLISKRFTSLSDVWSYGIVLWELATIGGEPYVGYSREELVDEISSGERLPKPDNCSDKLYHVMLACWAYNEVIRPTFSNLLTMVEDLLESNEQYISLNIDADSVYYRSN